MSRSLGVAFALVVLPACVANTDEPSQLSADATATTYVEALDYWKAPGDRAAWQAMIKKVEHEFDDVCGDTFCGGDYSNLTSLGFTCSVTSQRGSTHECVWTFAGSSHLVKASTGTVAASVASFQCRIELKSSARALLTLLGQAGGDPSIRRVLPGTTQSLYDVVGDCFQHPVGASPVSQGLGTTYSDAADATGTDQGAYYDAEGALRASFDARCGDTFCSGAYPNLSALRLACSARATTGTLKECKWLIEGSYQTIEPSTGAITVHPKSSRCILPVKGSVTQLITTLNAPSAVPPIDRPLPGTTKSAYDALLGCL